MGVVVTNYPHRCDQCGQIGFHFPCTGCRPRDRMQIGLQYRHGHCTKCSWVGVPVMTLRKTGTRFADPLICRYCEVKIRVKRVRELREALKRQQKMQERRWAKLDKEAPEPVQLDGVSWSPAPVAVPAGVNDG